MKNEVYKKTLSNGLRIVLSSQPSKDIIAFKLFIKVGSQNDGQNYGITHMLEHALFNNKAKNKAIFYEIERHGGVVNANTARDFLSIYIVICKEYFYKSMLMVLDLVFDYFANAEVLEAEKKIILQEILTHQNSTGAMWDLFLMSYWNKHPLRYPIRGCTESIEKINCDILDKHYMQFVTPNNMVISCAGNIIKEELLSNIEEYFNRKGRISKETKTDTRTEEIARDRIYVNRDLLMTHFFMAYPIPKFNNKVNLKAISKLLGEGAFSRLYQILREEKKLVYSVECKEIYYDNVGIFLIYTKCNNENIMKVEDIINFELNSLKTKSTSEDTMSFLKTNFKGSLERNFETSLSVCNSFGIEEVLSNLSTSITFKDAITNFNQITPEDIMHTSVKYLDNPKVIVIGKNNT